MKLGVELVLSWVVLGIIGGYLANRMRAHPLPLSDLLSFAILGALFFGLAGWAALGHLAGSTALALLGGAAAIGLAPSFQQKRATKRKWRAVLR